MSDRGHDSGCLRLVLRSVWAPAPLGSSRHERGFRRNRVNCHFLDKPDQQKAQPQACCGVVRNAWCDGSAPSGTVFEVSAALPPKPAIACTS